jgi:hypothetical protein
MSKDADDNLGLSLSRLQLGSHEVGYGRPPAATRFVKGQSGNPAGRPRGSKNKPAELDGYDLRHIVLAEANRAIEINERDEVVTIPMAQAVMRKIGIDAMKGRPRAQELFIKTIDKARYESIQLHERHLQMVCEYKAFWEQELDRRARLGITHLPEPLPHPDDIVIDLQTGEVEYHGPRTREEEAQYEALRKQLIRLQDGLPDLDAILKKRRSPAQRKDLEQMKQTVLERIALFETVLPAAYVARKGKVEAASQE